MTTAPPPPYNPAAEVTNNPTEKPTFDTASAASFDAWDKAASSSPTQKLTIKYGDVRARHGTLTDPATSQPIYTSEHRYRKPTFALNGPDGRPIATACSHTWTMKMDVDIAGRQFELTPRGKLSCSVVYASPAYGDQQLLWDNRYSWGHIEYLLLDEAALPIARFRGGSVWKCLPWGEFGTFEFVEGRVQTEAQRDEVVATGLTLAYRAVVNRNASISSASSASGVAAAVASS